MLETLTPTEIFISTGMYPSRVSELRHGKLARFSIPRLLRYFARQGFDVEVTIRPTKAPVQLRKQPRATVVRYDRSGRLTTPVSDTTSQPT